MDDITILAAETKVVSADSHASSSSRISAALMTSAFSVTALDSMLIV